MSMADKVLPEKYNYNYYDFYIITTDNHKASFENLKSVLDENGLGDMNELICTVLKHLFSDFRYLQVSHI